MREFTPPQSGLPVHVALILDGNRRWARQRKKSHEAGYRAGIAATRALVEHAVRRGISILTLFAFSSENRKRPKPQVELLMGLLVETLDAQARELMEQGIELRFIGELDRLSSKIRSRIRRIEAQAPAEPNLTLCVALHYGGRQDLLSAFQRCQEADADAIGEALGTAGLPDPDLLIRTGGEFRLSNFLLWQLAYTELYFTDCLWPDFGEAEFDRALEWFAARERRYGGSVG
ncbi:MAG: polyprenyl diphosphate synthase [Gammaproteobacteria bacterium]|nr:polyprenyl diphosphate synthase [Gammaproteobacteria bacterium]